MFNWARETFPSLYIDLIVFTCPFTANGFVFTLEIRESALPINPSFREIIKKPVRSLNMQRVKQLQHRTVQNNFNNKIYTR